MAFTGLLPSRVEKERWFKTQLQETDLLIRLGVHSWKDLGHHSLADSDLHIDARGRLRDGCRAYPFALRLKEARHARYQQFTMTGGSELDNTCARFYIQAYGDAGSPVLEARLVDLDVFYASGLAFFPDEIRGGGGSSGRQKYWCWDWPRVEAVNAVVAKVIC